MKRTLLDAVLVFAVAFACFTLIGLGMGFYKADGPRLVVHLRDGNPLWPQHPFYLPIVLAVRDLLAPLGLSPFRVAMTASAAGTALGLAFCRLGFGLLDRERARARFATVLVATCPATVLFGSVVEIHGVFFAFAGAAFALFAWLDRLSKSGRIEARTILVAALAGGACAVATGVHASGLLLPAIFCPWLVSRAVPWKVLDARNIAALILLLVHLGLTRLLADPASSADFVAAGFGRPQGIEHLPGVVLFEYVCGLGVLSLLAPLTVFARRTRREAAAYLVAVVPYCAAALLLLVGEPEFGAYLLPLSIPAAWLASRSLRGRVRAAVPWVAVVLACAPLLLFARATNSGRLPDLGSAFGAQRGVALIGTPEELEALLLQTPRVDPVFLDEIAKLPPATVRSTLSLFDARIRDAQAEGKTVWITSGARGFLQREPDALLPSGRVLWEHLAQNYELLPLRDGGPFRLQRKN